MECATGNNWLDFGGDPDRDADTGIFLKNFIPMQDREILREGSNFLADFRNWLRMAKFGMKTQVGRSMFIGGQSRPILRGGDPASTKFLRR